MVREYLCIHFPHKLSELMRGTLAHPAVVDALTELIGPNVKAMQSMLFIKSEGRPGQAWHQDELFISTRDRSLPNTGRHGLRRALVNHYMSAESLLPWFPPPDGVTMGRADHRDVVLVAGSDPYAYKAPPT